MDEKPGVKVIDFSQIVIAVVTANFEPNEVNIDMMRHVALNSIRNNVVKFNAKYPITVIARDNSTNNYWRRDLSYYYKKHRKLNHEEEKAEGGWDWDNIYECLNIIFAEIKENLPYICIDVEKVEADDIIGVLALELKDRDILILSSDGDFTQLHKGNVRQYSPLMKQWVKFKHGSARDDLLFKIITGDQKDTIANIKSKPDYYLTREKGDRAPSITKKFMAPLLESKDPKSLLTGTELERFIENEKLLDLTLIPEEYKIEILRQFDIKPAGKAKLYKYLLKHKLNKLMEKINEF